MTRAERLGLEPKAIHPIWDENEEAFEAEIELSKAISLKRIADALDGTALGVDISESLAGLTWQQVYKS